MCNRSVWIYSLRKKEMGPINLVASISTPHINLCMSSVIWCQWFSWKHLQSSTNFIQFSLRLHISRMDYSVCIELDWWQAQQAKSVCTVVSLQSCLNKSVTYCQTSLCMFWLTSLVWFQWQGVSWLFLSIFLKPVSPVKGIWRITEKNFDA